MSEQLPKKDSFEQTNLFADDVMQQGEATRPHEYAKVPPKMIHRSGTELFGKAVLREAIQLVPGMPETESLVAAREYFRDALHFSAQLTRQRYANYIVRRLFPDGNVDKALQLFAQQFANSRDLQEVCFYRFLKAEKLQVNMVDDLLIPAIGNGSLGRDRIRAYLSEKYPDSKSVTDCGKAVVDALIAGGIAKADRLKITFAYRGITIPAFAFILHSEFAEPGMYDIRKIEENRYIRAMLWNPEKIMLSLYELRNKEIISKISEIDNIRQFTTRYHLSEVVELLTVQRGGG
jgi:hypothetical protein